MLKTNTGYKWYSACVEQAIIRLLNEHREDACSRTGGIFIRDTALDTAYASWFNELWPNQGQTMRNHTPYHTAYATVWRMILGRMHALKCEKISLNHFKSRLKLWLWKKNVSHKSHSAYFFRLWIKEENGVYYKSNVSPYGSCYHSFCVRSSGVWNWGCVLLNWWRYGVWYVVVRYEWMIRTASCRINHTLIRDYTGRTKLNQISVSLFPIFFCNKSYMFTKERINDK